MAVGYMGSWAPIAGTPYFQGGGGLPGQNYAPMPGTGSEYVDGMTAGAGGVGGAGGYGGGYGGYNFNGWDRFSHIYPQYQQLMFQNNAAQNAAMTRAGGRGASGGTPFTNPMGQLAQQGAAGLASLFADSPRGGGYGGGYGGYGGDPNASAYARQAAESRLPWNDINNPWYQNAEGYRTYQKQSQQKMIESNADNLALNYAGYENQLTGLNAGTSQNKYSGAQADANRSLIPGQTNLSGAQTQQALQGLTGSGALQAGQTQQALGRLSSGPSTPPPGNPADYVWENGQWIYSPGKGTYRPSGVGTGGIGTSSGYGR